MEIEKTCLNCNHISGNIFKRTCRECVDYSAWEPNFNTEDNVNNPQHYQNGGIETINIIQMSLTPEEFKGYLKGNVLKYRERASYKGNTEEDYAKAKWYFDKLQEVSK